MPQMGQPPPGAPSATCPAPGTDVPFGKLMNPSFAADYQGCDVRTRATFWEASANPLLAQSIQDPASVLFQVNDPAVGEGSYETVKVSKAGSDLVFSSKKGDTLVLSGGTKPLYQGKFYFLASKIEKAP
jgi:hypothetical protein